MLRREITYEDFNGDQVTDVFYFNISKSELVELEVQFDQGFGAMLQKIIDERDNNELVKRFKEIILMAYGKKSEDGRRFIKSDEIREEFTQTAAYDTLFMELATDDKAASVFLKGILPKDMGAEIEKIETKVAPEVPSS
jgi:hypothetical protein